MLRLPLTLVRSCARRLAPRAQEEHARAQRQMRARAQAGLAALVGGDATANAGTGSEAPAGQAPAGTDLLSPVCGGSGRVCASVGLCVVGVLGADTWGHTSLQSCDTQRQQQESAAVSAALQAAVLAAVHQQMSTMYSKLSQRMDVRRCA